MPTGPEITAAAKILNRDHLSEYLEDWHAPLAYDPPNSRQVAKLVLEAAEAAREKGAKYVAVGRIRLPDGEWHNYAVGPFSTPLQAARGGEAFTHDPKSGTGEGKFRAVPLVNKAADAWNAIRPDQVDHTQWIKDQISGGLTGLSDPKVYEGKENW